MLLFQQLIRALGGGARRHVEAAATAAAAAERNLTTPHTHKPLPLIRIGATLAPEISNSDKINGVMHKNLRVHAYPIPHLVFQLCDVTLGAAAAANSTAWRSAPLCVCHRVGSVAHIAAAASGVGRCDV